MSVLLRSKTQIFGLVTDLATLTNAIATEVTDRGTAITTVDGRITTEVGTLNTTITNLDTATLKKASNLSDVASVATARTNLSIDSSAEVDAKITAAQLALGTRFRTADITARDALAGLDLADSVFVTDDGDGKWAIYQPSAVNGAGNGTAWDKLADQDSLTNSITAAGLKTAYESNADTNAYTDADKAKVGFVSVTAAIDLDKVIQSDELLTSATLTGATDTNIASALAIKSYVDATANAGGAVFKTESVTVASDKIVLLFKPKDGMVLNFGTVRHIDANGVAYDIPVAVDGSDATGKTYTLAADTAGQFDAKSVTVQYPYTL